MASSYELEQHRQETSNLDLDNDDGQYGDAPDPLIVGLDIDARRRASASRPVRGPLNSESVIRLSLMFFFALAFFTIVPRLLLDYLVFFRLEWKWAAIIGLAMALTLLISVVRQVSDSASYRDDKQRFFDSVLLISASLAFSLSVVVSTIGAISVFGLSPGWAGLAGLAVSIAWFVGLVKGLLRTDDPERDKDGREHPIRE